MLAFHILSRKWNQRRDRARDHPEQQQQLQNLEKKRKILGSSGQMAETQSGHTLNKPGFEKKKEKEKKSHLWWLTLLTCHLPQNKQSELESSAPLSVCVQSGHSGARLPFPHAGRERAARTNYNNGGKKKKTDKHKKKKQQTCETHCTFFLIIGEPSGICKYYVCCLVLSDWLDLFFATAGASWGDFCGLSCVCFWFSFVRRIQMGQIPIGCRHMSTSVGEGGDKIAKWRRWTQVEVLQQLRLALILGSLKSFGRLLNTVCMSSGGGGGGEGVWGGEGNLYLWFRCQRVEEALG